MNKRLPLLKISLLVLMPLSLMAQQAKYKAYRIQDSKIETLAQQLAADEHRARIVRPLFVAGTVAGAGLGIVGLYWYITRIAGFEVPQVKNISDLDKKDLKDLKDALNRDTVFELPVSKLQNAFKILGKNKEAAGSQPWYKRAGHALALGAPVFIGKIFIEELVKWVWRAADMPKHVDRGADYLLSSHSLAWYKEHRTTFDITHDVLANNIVNYQHPIVLKAQYKQVMYDLQNAELVLAQNPELSVAEQKGYIQELKNQRTILESTLLSYKEQSPVIQRRALVGTVSLLSMQVEKLLAYMVYTETLIKDAKLANMDKLNVLAYGHQIREKIKHTADVLTDAVEQECSRERDFPVLEFGKQAIELLTFIKQELRNFVANVESARA